MPLSCRTPLWRFTAAVLLPKGLAPAVAWAVPCRTLLALAKSSVFAPVERGRAIDVDLAAEGVGLGQADAAADRPALPGRIPDLQTARSGIVVGQDGIHGQGVGVVDTAIPDAGTAAAEAVEVSAAGRERGGNETAAHHGAQEHAAVAQRRLIADGRIGHINADHAAGGAL